MNTLHDIWQHHYDSDFAAGVRLLVEHNPSAVTSNILRRLQELAFTPGSYVGEYEKGKLRNALQGTVVDTPPPPPPPTGGEFVETTATEKAPGTRAIAVMPPLHSGDGKGLTSDLAIALHKEHSHVHALLVAATTDEQRAEYSRDIMERIIPALDAEYDRLREAAKSGGDFKSPPDSEDNTSPGPILNAGDARAFKKLQSVRSRISTLRKKIPLEKDPKRKAKLEQELETKQAEKERLEAELS